MNSKIIFSKSLNNTVFIKGIQKKLSEYFDDLTLNQANYCSPTEMVEIMKESYEFETFRYDIFNEDEMIVLGSQPALDLNASTFFKMATCDLMLFTQNYSIDFISTVEDINGRERRALDIYKNFVWFKLETQGDNFGNLISVIGFSPYLLMNIYLQAFYETDTRESKIEESGIQIAEKAYLEILEFEHNIQSSNFIIPALRYFNHNNINSFHSLLSIILSNCSKLYQSGNKEAFIHRAKTLLGLYHELNWQKQSEIKRKFTYIMNKRNLIKNECVEEIQEYLKLIEGLGELVERNEKVIKLVS